MIVNVTVQEFLTQNVFCCFHASRKYPSVRQYNLIQKVQKKTTTTATAVAAAVATVDEFFGGISFLSRFEHWAMCCVFFSGPKVKTSKIDHRVLLLGIQPQVIFIIDCI